MAERDRDEQGRARNARPRDALGRPLPYGVPGIATMPDDLDLPPEDSLRLAQKLLDEGRPFHAHEVLEAAWKSAPERDRELWKGLAQLAVGFTHVRRGNEKGAITLLSRAVQRISGYPDPPHGIAAARLTDHAGDLIDRIERDGLQSITAARLRPKLKT
ncbi:DUF309 domain-containing protein [Fodinicola acaciae]|uniref:DUF309 domain-containing protein n=1 Tax=Fodinicola acaciae TaxID=2681555 RepID=UPI0013D1AFD3|nr:DUF309 domain-containing protein [Fodinicola acaciae]